MKIQNICVIPLLILALVACETSTVDTKEDVSTPVDDVLNVGETTAPSVPFNGAISEADFDKWPFTVRSGQLNCLKTNGQEMVTFVTDDGTVYPLNGVASANAEIFGMKPLESIWKDDPESGAKVSVGPFIKLGLELCSPSAS